MKTIQLGMKSVAYLGRGQGLKLPLSNKEAALGD